MKKFQMTKKWNNTKTFPQDFIEDFNRLTDFITQDYKKIGFDTRLVISQDKRIDFSLGVKTCAGYRASHYVLRQDPGSSKVTTSSVFIKERVSSYAIYLLLFKYGFANEVPQDEEDEDIVQEAQLQLINLNII